MNINRQDHRDIPFSLCCSVVNHSGKFLTYRKIIKQSALSVNNGIPCLELTVFSILIFNYKFPLTGICVFFIAFISNSADLITSWN